MLIFIATSLTFLLLKNKQDNIIFFSFSCSVSCFKEHRCEKKDDSFVIDPTPNEVINEQSYLLEIPDDYKIPEEVLEQLKYSDEVKSLLTNHNLRDFLQFTHETYNPSGFMKLAMREPLFLEFANACLRAIRPEDYPKIEPTDQEIVDFVKKELE